MENARPRRRAREENHDATSRLLLAATSTSRGMHTITAHQDASYANEARAPTRIAPWRGP